MIFSLKNKNFKFKIIRSKKMTIFWVFLFICPFFITQIDKNKDSLQILSLLKKSNKLRQSSIDYKVYQLIVEAQNLSKKNHFHELHFISTIELADFYIMISNYKKAKETFKKINPSRNYQAASNCKYYHRKAFLFNQINLLDSAIYFSNKALKIANKNKLLDEKGTIYNELGYVYEKQGDLRRALEYYNVACEVYKNNPLYFANTYLNKARIIFKLGQYNKAILLLKENERTISETEWHKVKCPIYFYLSQAYFKINDSLNAYKFLNRNTQELVIIREQEQSNTLNRFIVKYEIKQKNEEILKQKTIILKNDEQRKILILILFFLAILLIFTFVFYFVMKTKNNRLHILNKENDFLVGEANHRIKNNLQLILSLLADEKEKNIGKKNEYNSITNITTKIEAITTLHKQLYLNKDKSLINLSDYLYSVYQNLSPILQEKGINIKINFCNVLFDANKSVYIGLLVNELITNGFKYAFLNNEQNKSIILTINENNGFIEIFYHDNGIGLKNNIRPQLIDLLCKQLKSKAEFKNENGLMFKSRINK
jgi:two-component sensor histidine kinase